MVECRMRRIVLQVKKNLNHNQLRQNSIKIHFVPTIKMNIEYVVKPGELAARMLKFTS